MKKIALLIIVFAQCAFAQVTALPPKELFLSNNLVQRSPATESSGKQSVMETEFFQQEGAFEKKSVVQAALYSLLLPGMGELYAGNYGMGKWFTMGEGALWLTWAGFSAHATWVQDDARNYAVQHAGINLNEKSDQYYIDIGNFISTASFDQEMERERLNHKTYGPDSPLAWQWDTDANREQYRTLRVSSDDAFNNAKFVIAAIITNHVVSAINAGRMAISHNKSSDASLYQFRTTILGDLVRPNGLMFSVARTF